MGKMHTIFAYAPKGVKINCLLEKLLRNNNLVDFVPLFYLINHF